jgi:DNA repair protein SbcD/Mre11
MKILHTADWHLGKKLYQKELVEEQRLFLEWLIQQIEEQHVEVLLVAGDIFDSSHPSAESLQLYYDFLTQLIPLHCQLVLVGGNHDSVGVLNAPQQILRRLRIHVVGGATNPWTDELIFLENRNKTEQVVVAAVPFLRDRDLKKSQLGESIPERRRALHEGIAQHYQQLFDFARQQYPDVPCLATGHLFVQGSAVSDNDERLHAMGTLEVFDAGCFPAFDYLALGHIHRSQMIGNQNHVRYAGSAVSLNFSERNDQKSVVCVNIEGRKVSYIEAQAIPKWRHLRRFRGSFEEVHPLLDQYQWAGQLPTWAEVEILADTRDPSHIEMVKQYFGVFKKSEIEVLNYRFVFAQHEQQLTDFFGEDTSLQTLSEHEVFDKFLETKAIAPEDQEVLRQAFRQLREELG